MRPTQTQGFTLMELLISIAVLMFGMFGVLAVFASTAEKAIETEEKYTAGIITQSVANAIQIAFATPIDPDFDQGAGTGPKIRIDHDGLFTNPEDPSLGFAVITLPALPDVPGAAEPTLPENIDPIVYPAEGVYQMGQFLDKKIEEEEEGGLDTEDEENKAGQSLEVSAEHIRQYSFTLTFRNWRTKYRPKVPPVDGDNDPGTYHPDNENAVIKPFRIGRNDYEFVEIGSNRGYEVTIRVYRSIQARDTDSDGQTQEDLAEREALEDLESEARISRERFVFVVSPSFGITDE